MYVCVHGRQSVSTVCVSMRIIIQVSIHICWCIVMCCVIAYEHVHLYMLMFCLYVDLLYTHWCVYSYILCY